MRLHDRWADGWRAFRERGYRSRSPTRSWPDNWIDRSIVAAYICPREHELYPEAGFDTEEFRAAAIYRQDPDWLPKPNPNNLPEGVTPSSGLLYVVLALERRPLGAVVGDWKAWDDEADARTAARTWVGPGVIDVPFYALGHEAIECVRRLIRRGPNYGL